MMRDGWMIRVLSLALLLLWGGSAAAGQEGTVREVGVGENVERELPLDTATTAWVREEDKGPQGDRIEKRQVTEKVVKTVKLRNVVPAIHFGSGEADIPTDYVNRLRDALEKMKRYENVRLHFIGHSDNVPLTGAAAARYGDNLGLSRERAGVVAEFVKGALKLPPEAISYDGLGESQPIASNATSDGKAQNRRVEVEVWYDEISEQQVEREVVVGEEMSRVKVCRMETVCKLRYKEGHARRARVRNMVPPLHLGEEGSGVPPEFAQRVAQALDQLREKQNVTVKLIGFTDNAPLEGRDERIYGTHLALSKARARRAALALQETLKLPGGAVESDGRGTATPVAGNDSASGRALNRRVEVEFWYDDPLQELSDEPQICPEAAGAETVTRFYEPPSGPIEAVRFEQGQPVVTDEYLARLRQILGEVSGKSNVRFRFIGFTANERLDRRTAMAYGDDIGLSTARARRVMEKVRDTLGLTGAQTEHEGRGYVQSQDVVNAGFVEADTSRVEVQLVYDELAAMDESDAVDITRITREVQTANPFALNEMRITVDGAPLDDPGKSTQDVQRCTDVALEQAHIRFRFDNLEMKPRLNVTAWPLTIRYRDDDTTEVPENLVRFRTYNNYPGFIARAEIRIFGKEESTRSTPLAIVPVGTDGAAEWSAQFDNHATPMRELQYLVRVYDAAGHYDETSPQSLWVVEKVSEETEPAQVKEELLAGYGENRLALSNIPLAGGTVKVYGSAVPEGHAVWLGGESVPVGKKGDFVAERILPQGVHTVELSVLDATGSGELFLRDLELKRNDWFYVGIADFTASQSVTSGPAQLVTNEKGHYDNDLCMDGRLAGYARGKFWDDWRLTASADTREGPVGELFTNFMKKLPDALFRRVDPDYYYPTYGDDGTVEEGAPTMGKFYVKVEKEKSFGLWGNFKADYNDNSLVQVDRGLYGAELHLQPGETTSFGEERLVVDGFAAQPGTVAGRDEFRGTGGSLYYLRHQDILSGSERVRIEIRDKDSGLVTAVKNLTAGLDYTVDYLQGRVLLSEPLASSVSDELLVSSAASAGDPAFLVVRYEFTPGFDDMENLSNGGDVHYWLGDYVRLGATSNQNQEAGEKSSVNGYDLLLRKSPQTWVKLESGASQGNSVTASTSADGGFNYADGTTMTPDTRARAWRVDTHVGLAELYEGGQGDATLYKQFVEGGYSSPGTAATKDTDQYGGSVTLPVGERVDVRAKADRKYEEAGLETSSGEVDLDYRLDDNWTLSGGARNEYREDRSPVVPLTQVEGNETDLVTRATYDSHGSWLAYAFAQDTVVTTGNQEQNDRVGTGGAYRVTDRLRLTAEASTGDLGGAGRFGAEYLWSDRTNLYTNYALENERTDNGVRARKGSMISGFRSRYTDTTSVYAEERYTHGDVPTGLTHATGVDLAPNDRWNYGASADYGELRDPETAARTERSALALRVGYGYEKVSAASALEYRVDKSQNPDLSETERTTWLTKNSLKYQITPDWRFVGKLDHSVSESTQGEFYDGSYTELVAGYGYRRVENDRLNTLVKYTYFYNLPASTQETVANSAAEFIQRSHIFSFDAIYDLTPQWSVGGKYAYRMGQVAMDRTNPEFFDSRAHLYIARLDWHITHEWDALVEERLLDLPDAHDRRSGHLAAIYRHITDNVKIGVGYNFTDFSDDLTDLTYDNAGGFVNVVGSI
jgi:flagellar motor protein MotB